MIKYRTYQIHSYNKVIDALRHHNKVILRLPTGAGKSHIALRLVEAGLKAGKRICFICERITLINQIADHAENRGLPYSVIRSSDPRYEWTCNFQIASAQTIVRRKRWDQGGGFDLIIIDECHLLHKIHRDLLTNYDAKFIGLSATPWRKDLGVYWDYLIDEIKERDLINQGYLSQWEAYGPPDGIVDALNLKVTRGEYDEKETYKRFNHRRIYANIVSTWKRLSPGKNTLIFATNIEHSKRIAERFKRSGENSHHVDAYTDESDFRSILSNYKQNPGSILCSVAKLSTGFDLPSAETIIIARTLKSHMTHYQMIGRGMRTSPGKDKALFIDHAGNMERLGTPDNPPRFCLGQDIDNSNRVVNEKKRIYCKKCGKLKKSLKCPHCGHESKVPNTVDEVKGELQKIGGLFTAGYKDKVMRMFKHHELEKGYKNGWSIYMYKEMFKEEPRHKWPRLPITPDNEIQTFINNRIKYQRIRYARSSRCS